MNNTGQTAYISTSKRAKTEREFVCKHCGKKYTKRYNLDSHMTTHGVTETFVCFYCGKNFARNSDLTRHIKAHTDGKAYVCGGTLQNGQAWGCGQSFNRADILSNHHKSKKGRKCLAALEHEERAQVAE
jgi:uncharacterized Zn-finger protein